jgi:YbbR domain-containing protein
VARLVRFLVRNWPLKLGAVALASVLYAGLVVSQSVRVWPGPVQIQPINQPAGAFLMESLGSVTDIHYTALPEIAAGVTGADFRASVDLRTVQPRPGGPPAFVPVHVQALDPRIQVVDFRPQQVAVRLDPIIVRTVPVTVDRGGVPEGLDLGEPQLEAATVSVRGASSLVQNVREAVARVLIDPNAINVDADVPLIAVDARGDAVQPVDIEPEEVHVRIRVEEQRRTRALPVVPRFAGALPSGYEARAVTVTPPVVNVAGGAALLGQLDSVPTQPISLAGRTTDLLVNVGLALPQNAIAVDASRVRVSVDVVPRRGSRSFTTGLTLAGARPDRAYRVAAPSVLVTLAGTLSVLERLDPASLRASLDVSRLALGTRELPVVVTPPRGTAVVSVSPPRVRVTAQRGTPTSPPTRPGVTPPPALPAPGP